MRSGTVNTRAHLTATTRSSDAALRVEGAKAQGNTHMRESNANTDKNTATGSGI